MFLHREDRCLIPIHAVTCMVLCMNFQPCRPDYTAPCSFFSQGPRLQLAIFFQLCPSSCNRAHIISSSIVCLESSTSWWLSFWQRWSMFFPLLYKSSSLYGRLYCPFWASRIQ